MILRKQCEKCSSTDVCKDADAIWNETTQTWELDPNTDLENTAGYCRNCETEVEIVDLPDPTSENIVQSN